MLFIKEVSILTKKNLIKRSLSIGNNLMTEICPDSLLCCSFLISSRVYDFISMFEFGKNIIIYSFDQDIFVGISI